MADDYVTQDQHILVQDDITNAEESADDGVAGSDEQLARDENVAIDRSNIINERTRHANQTGNEYNEGPSEENLP